MSVLSLINRTHRRSMAMGLTGAMLLFAGCATTPMPPTAALNEAQIAIKAAERGDARRYAGAELDEAQYKLTLAGNAVKVEDMVLAERFARESIATAELAEAQSEAAKAETINDEMRRSANALLEEMRRAGDQP